MNKGSSHINVRGGGDEVNDVLDVPDGVWEAEGNNTSADTVVLRQSSPPSTGCLNIRLIYNNGWVQSSANGDALLGRQRALDVLAEAESIYNAKFSSSNRLGTALTFNLVGGGKLNNVSKV